VLDTNALSSCQALLRLIRNLSPTQQQPDQETGCSDSNKPDVADDHQSSDDNNSAVCDDHSEASPAEKGEISAPSDNGDIVTSTNHGASAGNSNESNVGERVITHKKCLVFSQWTYMLDLVEVLLEKEKIKFVRLDGSVSQVRSCYARQHDTFCCCAPSRACFPRPLVHSPNAILPSIGSRLTQQ